MRLPLRMAAVPPRRAAAVDQPVEFGAGDNPEIGRPPCLIVSIRHRTGITRLGATDLDEDGAHGAIKASSSATFKCRDSRSAHHGGLIAERRALRHRRERKNIVRFVIWQAVARATRSPDILRPAGPAYRKLQRVADSSPATQNRSAESDGPHTRSASFRRSSFLRSWGSSSFLRSRIDFGVTSTSSSSSI